MVTAMTLTTTSLDRRLTGAEPTWDIAKLFPMQGHWNESEYLRLNGNYLVEFTHGHVEVLPMPTPAHQAIVAFLFEQLLLFVRPAKLGKVLFAPLRVRMQEGKFREPDVVFILAAHSRWQGDDFWEGADLVREVVSDDFRKHDLETKRLDYALAGIPEYWIVDPMLREITVLKLAGDRYDVHGIFKEAEIASSILLPGFEVKVTDAFAAGDGK
jgi:Uma2 family endonuclease